MQDKKPAAMMTRRRLIKLMGIGAVTLPVVKLLGCTEEDANTDPVADMDSADMGTSEDMGATEDMGTAAAGAWATGGTAAMTDIDSYPNPFAAGVTACALSCGATIGPCHTGTEEREDISDGWDGLPVRLSLLVVNEECEPMEDVIVEVWHTNYHGIYSGEIQGICNDAQEDRAAAYFRGYQRTDAQGRVNFNTCYPGWYSGRVVHFHVRVQSGDYAAADSAAAEVITQLFFSDELNNEIFTEQSLYQAYGLPDTQLATDNVVGGEDDPSPYVLDVQQMSDGAMLASKTIILQSSSANSCTLAGSANGGPGGMGGPPGG